MFLFTWTIWTNQYTSKWIRFSSAKYKSGDVLEECVWFLPQLTQLCVISVSFMVYCKITPNLFSFSPTITLSKSNYLKICRFFPKNKHKADEKKWCCFGRALWLIFVSLFQETHAASSSDWRRDGTGAWASHLKIPWCSWVKQIRHNYADF